MRICMFTKALPIHIVGGMEMHIESLVNGLIKKGHHVTIITGPHPQGLKNTSKNNIDIYYTKTMAKYTRERYYRESARIFDELNQIENFDIVHSQSTLALGYIRYCQKTVPLVVTLHGTLVNEIKNLLKINKALFLLSSPFWIKSYIFDERVILKKTDKIITVSKELCSDVKEQYTSLEGRLCVIPNGVDIDKFKPTEIDAFKSNLGLSNKKIILSIGRIEKEKGFQSIIKVFPDIIKTEDTILVILGIGSYLEQLKQLARDLNIEDYVIFAGHVNDNDLPKYYNLADLFVFPTLRLEGLPMVILEAMACGKPVIASRIGGIPTAIDHNKNGILIDPNNLYNLKNKILDVLVDERKAKTLGKMARLKAIEEFSVDRMVESTVAVYDNVRNLPRNEGVIK